jgi:hypothetical protein
VTGGDHTAWAITQTTRLRDAVVQAGAVDVAALYGQRDIRE